MHLYRQFTAILSGALLLLFNSYGQSTTVDTIQELRNLQPGISDEVRVNGYYQADDWGDPRTYKWVDPSQKADNGGTVIVPRTASTGRWIMQVTEDYYNVKWFGARGQDNPDHNDHVFIMNAINAAMSGPKRVKIPIGIYQVRGSISLRPSHNGLELFGAYVAETTQEDSRGFRTVVSSQSTVIKRADTGPYTSNHIIVTSSSDTEDINNITIRNLATDGNRHNTANTSAGHNYLANHGRDVGQEGIFFENFYAFRCGWQGDDLREGSGNGIQLYGDNVRFNRLLIYDVYFHGIGVRAENILLEDVEVYDVTYQYGVDFSGSTSIGSIATLRNFSIHNSRRGIKTQDAKDVKIIEGSIKDIEITGFTVQDSYTDKWRVDLYMENVKIKNTGESGLHLAQDLEKAHLINIDLTNTLAYITVPNVEIFGLTSDGYNGSSPYAVRIFGSSADVTIHNLKLKNSQANTAGLEVFRGNAVIKSGIIQNNNLSGIHIRDGGTLTIGNTKFGDLQDNPSQTNREIYDDGRGTLYHSRLDFSESVISPEHWIEVNTVQEVGAVFVREPEFDVVIDKEQKISIEVETSHPSTKVTKVEFYANDTMIGERSNPPFSFEWSDVESGSYIIKVRAYFDDNSTAESNAVRVYVSGRHSMILQQGWNTISSFIKPNEEDIETIFEDLEENISLVLNNNGDVYWPVYDINEIGTWDSQEAYQVYMNAPATLTLYGQYLDPGNTSIYLKSGWNLKAYISEEPMPIETALRSVESSIEIVTNNVGDMYWPSYDVNTIGDMQPGEGYRIYAARPSTLIYPVQESPNVKISGVDKESTRNITIPKPQRYKIASENTGSNAFLLIISDGFQNGDEVGVWNTDDILVGSGVVNNNRAAITIWGRNTMNENSRFGARDDELLRLTLWSDNEEKEIPLRLNSLSCLTHGELDDPVIRYEEGAILIAGIRDPDAVPDRYALHQNYPNPFNPTTTIEYTIPRDEEVTLQVYNLLGQKIKTLVDEGQKSGTHRVVFKADNLSSGVYFYRLIAGNYTEIKRMIVIR